MNNSTTKLMFSSEDNEWATPQLFFDKLDNKLNFTLDPCATKKTLSVTNTTQRKTTVYQKVGREKLSLLIHRMAEN